MLIDLHIHSKDCSDGKMTVKQIIKEAAARNIELISITDHDSTQCQQEAMTSARNSGINCVSGVELNVTYSHPKYRNGKSISLDLLGYQFDLKNKQLKKELERNAEYRRSRAVKILTKLNAEFEKEGTEKLVDTDFEKIQGSVDGVLGRVHIADYLISKGIVGSRQEAFDKYLVKCNVPKFPLSIPEASRLVRDAGGIVVLAHPNDPRGTSLADLTNSLGEQTEIIAESMLAHLDGVECWHSRNDNLTTDHYIRFARKHRMVMTGGSDCHQNPIIMGTVKVPEYVAAQFKIQSHARRRKLD